MRSALLLLMLTPFCVGWNGSGVAHTDVALGPSVEPSSYRSEAVCAAHQDRVEIIVAIPLRGRGAGDGVLSLRFARRSGFRFELPHYDLVAHYHEYSANGAVRFAATEVIDGFARLSGDPRGALELGFSGTFVDGATKRVVETDSRLIALDWEPQGTRNRGEEVDDAVPEGYYEGGCSGTYYDYDDDDYADDAYGDNQSYDDGGGCGGDDLDDDGPASSGGCDGDDDFDSDDDYDSDDSSGCEGDDIDSDDSYDSDDSDSGCEGDNVDAMVVSCARGGGGGGPWVRRAVRWLPWLCVFLAIRLMRRRQPLSHPA